MPIAVTQAGDGVATTRVVAPQRVKGGELWYISKVEPTDMVTDWMWYARGSQG